MQHPHVAAHRHHLPEAVQVELPVEAGEAAGLEGTSDGREQLGLESPLVYEDTTAEPVPAYRADPRLVHKLPQLGGESLGVDEDGVETIFLIRGLCQ